MKEEEKKKRVIGKRRGKSIKKGEEWILNKQGEC